MIGGMMKTTSLLALAATASLFATSVNAADLGGNCCADLEERIAELEATTARKGNRKVSLEVSGWVHSGVMWFDGASGNTTVGALATKESNTYWGINRPESNSRFRFVGKAAISPKMNAGYLIEIQVNTSNSDSFTTRDDDGGTGANQLAVRHSAWWIEHKDYGKVWVGQTSQSTDGITEIQLSNTGHFANQNTTAGSVLNTFFPVAGPFGFTGFQLRNFMGGSSTDSSQIGEGNRRNLVRYDSPTLHGFMVSASIGEDDFWDVALRYAGEHHGFKVAFGIGYESTSDGPRSAGAGSERNCFGVLVASNDTECQQLGLSGSIMHMSSGLFVNGYYGWRQDDKVVVIPVLGIDDTSTRWGIMAGIEKNFFGMGKTTFYGEYAQWDIGFTPQFNLVNPFIAVGSEMTMWGLGVNQNIEAAAMDLYIQYRNYDPTVISPVFGKIGMENISMIMAGGKINF